MKFPKEVNENGPELKKNIQKSNANIETKTLDENNGIVVEETDTSDCLIEPNATVLIPPWIRNSLGFGEKGDRLFSGKTVEMKSDPDDACMKNNFCKSSSSNAMIEVNIENGADFPEEVADPGGKLSSVRKSRVGKRNQYDCNIFGVSKENRNAKSAKSEMTSIDVIVSAEDPEEEKRKVRIHKTKNKTYKKISAGGAKNDNLFKTDPEVLCKTNAREAFPKGELEILNSSGVKQLDARLLLLCGKNAIDNLTEEDVSLLQEMKNQIGHKEGFEKLFNEIKEVAFTERSVNKETSEGKKERGEKREEREATNERFKRERTKLMSKVEYDSSPHANGFTTKTDESEAKLLNNFLNKNKAAEEERRYLEEARKHYERKKLSQHKLLKHSEEAETEKDKKPNEKYRTLVQRANADREKKSKWRQGGGDLSVIEKAVSEILQKFIEFYRFQIPPDIVCSMKKNIIQTLQRENSDSGPKKNVDVVLAVQDEFRNAETGRGSVRSLLMEEREDKSNESARRVGEATFRGPEALPAFSAEENIVSKDVPPDGEDVKNRFRTLLTNVKENKFGKENDVGEDQNLKELKNEFEQCLKSIQAQLDITGIKLCSVILEKDEIENVPNKKIRIVHDFPTGATESIKIYNEKLNMGSPEGDNTSVKVCHCRTGTPLQLKNNQFSQTKEKEFAKNGTQTDCVDLSNGTDLAPGLYRIIKTAEFGSFYLCPEIIDEDPDDKVGKANPAAPETCDPVGNDISDKYEEVGDKSVSRETFASERVSPVNVGKKLRRAFKSDCLGLNKIELEELTRAHSRISLVDLLSGRLSVEKQELPLPMPLEDESVPEKEVNSEEGEVMNSESYHVGCVWFWNGKKMDPGVDLKVHVEDLLREKLRELLSEVRIEESKHCETPEGKSKIQQTVNSAEDTNILPGRSSEKNLEIRKTHGKFCIANNHPLNMDFTPFIFGGSGREEDNFKTQIPEEERELQRLDIDDFVKSYREVGTQNSQHTFVSLNVTKLKPRSKLCTVAKFSKQRSRKYASLQKTGNWKSGTSSAKALSFAENVGEAKKVKLEFRESNETASKNEKVCNGESLRECFSIISNGSSSSAEGPIRVKLIGIEVSKEKKLSEEGESCKETKKFSSEEDRVNLREFPKKYKHWELIENVLNRVSQKEKDSLWNDIRDFVKKKIGRDINDEGAREVCIEIEQDVPKFCSGKSSQAVVAKGNYTRNEGDVEVEVDLTFDDLERILRHRQKKLRRRHNYHRMKVDSKNSFSSSATSSEGTLNLTSSCSGFGGNSLANYREIKTSKEEK